MDEVYEKDVKRKRKKKQLPKYDPAMDQGAATDSEMEPIATGAPKAVKKPEAVPNLSLEKWEADEYTSEEEEETESSDEEAGYSEEEYEESEETPQKGLTSAPVRDLDSVEVATSAKNPEKTPSVASKPESK